MSLFPDITRLRTSWTKYDSVQAIEVVINNEIQKYINREAGIDEPVFKSFLVSNNLKLNQKWQDIF